jgi:hypothetical protein
MNLPAFARQTPPSIRPDAPGPVDQLGAALFAAGIGDAAAEFPPE